MDLEFLNTSGIDEDAWGKGKKKTRGSGTPAFTELAEESARMRWSRRKGGGVCETPDEGERAGSFSLFLLLVDVLMPSHERVPRPQ